MPLGPDVAMTDRCQLVSLIFSKVGLTIVCDIAKVETGLWMSCPRTGYDLAQQGGHCKGEVIEA